MTQLVCNGVSLDLYEGTGLQFKKTNPAFAFNAMSAERTTNFKLPATPKNDRVFGVSRVPAYNGDGMRRRFAAQLISGFVITNGFLYVSSFDGKDYNAVFVGGLAYDIKAFDASKWGELIFSPVFVSDTVYDASQAASAPVIARVKFHSNDGYRKPSINLAALFEMLNTQGIFKISGMTSSRLRLIRKDRYEIAAAKILLQNGTQATSEDLDLSTDNGLITIGRMYVAYDGPNDRRYFTNCFQCNGECYITFPEDTPQNLCLCYAEWDSLGGAIRFLGTRKFERQNGQTVYTGAPLAGQTVHITGTTAGTTITSGEQFVLITKEGAWYSGATDEYYFMDYSYYGTMDQVPPYSMYVRMSSDDYYTGQHQPSLLSMVDDLNLGDLLKMYAACNGLLINVKADGGVEFIAEPTDDYIPLNVIEQSEVNRTFSDYAQRNLIKFKDAETVQTSERLQAYYTIDNDNIEEEKELLTIAASEGGIYGGVYVVVRGDDDTLGETYNDEFMRRAAIVKNNYLQRLSGSSTQVRVRARMSMYEFAQIDSATAFIWRNTRYTWTEANWQKDTAQITLAKIA